MNAQKLPTVQLPKFIANEKGFPTRRFEFDPADIERETQKALLVDVTPLSYESDNCHRCGLEITNPVSRMVGYGPDCCEALGLNRPASEEEAEEWAERARKWIQAIKYKTWVPKRYVEGYTPKVEAPKPTSADVKDGNLVIESSYENRDRCRAVRGAKWDKNDKVWVAPATVASVEDFITAFENVQVDTTEAFDQFVLDIPDDEQAATDYTPVNHGLNINLWRHQIAAVNYAKDKAASMIPLKVGRGKTAVATALISHWKARRVLVIAPKFVSRQWPHMAKEYGLWEGEGALFMGLGEGGQVKQRAAKLDNAINSGKPVLACVNYEGMWRKPMDRIIASTDWDVIIADESHRIRNADSKQSKFMGKIAVTAKRRLALTGTPMAQTPLDVFGQYRFLDKTIFGDSWYRFRKDFAVTEIVSTARGTFEKIVGVKNRRELFRRYKSIAFQPAPGDDVELPDIQHIQRYFELGKKARLAYGSLLEEMYAKIGDGSLTPQNGAVRILRLQQITSGYAKLDPVGSVDNEEGVLKEIDTGKAELLAEVLEDIGNEPIVVFCKFRHDLDTVKKIAKKLGYGGGELSGRGDERNAWHAGKFNVLAVQIQAGAEGINDLVRSHYAVYFSIGHSLKDYEQSIGRLQRPGQKNDVTVFHLLANRVGIDFSVDTTIYNALQEKRDLINSVLEVAGN